MGSNSNALEAEYQKWLAENAENDQRRDRALAFMRRKMESERNNKLIRELIHNMKQHLLVAPVLIFFDVLPLYFWDSSKTSTEIANDPTPLTTVHEIVIAIWILAFIVSFFVFSRINGYLLAYPMLRKKLRRIAGEEDWRNPETRIGFGWKMYMVIIGICSVLYLIVALVPL
jgi:hypothetical protein